MKFRILETFFVYFIINREIMQFIIYTKQTTSSTATVNCIFLPVKTLFKIIHIC